MESAMDSEKEQDPITITEEAPSHQLQIPISRVKKIMKLDKEITKVNSEATFLVACCTELFIEFLADKCARVAIEKKKKTVKLDHLRIAVKRHQPTRDFLLDSLPPPPPQPSDQSLKEKRQTRSDKNPVPNGTRRIDAFFLKTS